MTLATDIADLADRIQTLERPAPLELVPASVVECPVCGRRREISARVVRAIAAGKRDGVCPTGEGCRSKISDDERMRRWWLDHAGVPRGEVLRAGGSLEYVSSHGLPDALGSLIWNP